MYASRSWESVISKSTAIAQGARDFTVPFRELEFACRQGVPILRAKKEVFDMSDHAVGQMCNRLEIPTKYFRRLRPRMQESVARYDIERFADKKDAFIRLVPNGDSGSKVRAFLSTEYVTLDNDRVLSAVQQVTGQVDHRVFSAWVDEQSMWLKLGFPGLSMPDPTRRGQQIHIGLLAGNSEVGMRSVMLMPFIHRQSCTNDMVIVSGWSFKHAHVAISQQAMVQKMGKVVEQIVNKSDEIFRPLLQSVNDRVRNPDHTLRAIAKELSLPKKRAEKLLEAFGKDPHPSRWGVVNALTQTAQELEGDARVELEMQAGQVVQFPAHKWEQFAMVA